MGNLNSPSFSWKEILKEHPNCLMGIINLTPDSFSGDGLYKPSEGGKTVPNLEVFRIELEKIYNDLAKKSFLLVDVGAESTRPGAESIELEEELRRVNLYFENININLNQQV